LPEDESAIGPGERSEHALRQGSTNAAYPGDEDLALIQRPLLSRRAARP
jgi:hypothetical protein